MEPSQPPSSAVLLNPLAQRTTVTTGFVSLLNPKDGSCPVTRGRRIQISQLEAHKRPAGDDGGPGRKKRWSFHSSNQINQLFEEDGAMKPVISPKRRKSGSGSTFTRSTSELCKIGGETQYSERRNYMDASLSSKRVLSNHQQLPQHRNHSKIVPIPIKGDSHASSSRTRQRIMEEYATFTEPPSPSIHLFRLRKPSKYCRDPPAPDYMSTMPDEILLRIFKYLPKASLANLGRTCQRFSGLIEDETLWKRLCVMGRMLSPLHLLIIMTRKPVYLRMSRAEIPDPEILPDDLSKLISTSQLRYLDLSGASLSTHTLSLIMKLSPKLVKLSLEHLTVTEQVIDSMTFGPTLVALNLTMCYELNAKAFIRFLSTCQSLQELNISCIKCDWSMEDLTDVVSALPGTLQQLNVSGFRTTLNDSHLSIIVSRCPKLLELDLSDSQEIQSKSIQHITKLKHIQHLGLSRCYGIEPPVYSFLSGNKYLKYLDIFSVFKENSLRQLNATLPGIEINKFPFSAIGRPTVGNKRSSIWLQRVRD